MPNTTTVTKQELSNKIIENKDGNVVITLNEFDYNGTDFAVMAKHPAEKERAAHIVKCWNLHDELVKMLKVAYNEIELMNRTGATSELGPSIRELITKATQQ